MKKCTSPAAIHDRVLNQDGHHNYIFIIMGDCKALTDPAQSVKLSVWEWLSATKPKFNSVPVKLAEYRHFCVSQVG